jgi:3-hydroxyisobutyrate dehydrogenase-like beta-hydroxyacid dehydrogenase
MAAHLRVAVIGQGEPGTHLAARLHAVGIDVILFNRIQPKTPATPLADSIEEAVAGAHVVLSGNPSSVSVRVAQQVAPVLEAGALYADFSTSTPAMKVRLASFFPHGSFLDVAMIERDSEPVEGSMAVAGTGAKKFIELLQPYGLTLEYVSEVAGETAARQLIRSLLAKGMAGLITDLLWAAESMGLEKWAYQEILEQFDSTSAATVTRYLTDTAKHVKRHQIEMLDIVEMLNESGYESTMIAPIEFNYGRLLHGKKIPFSKRP